MKINYDFYEGTDQYTDGDIEKEILKYTQEYDEKNFDKIFAKDTRWPVFYHLNSLRKNLLNWYPFSNEGDLLEIGAGMGALTRMFCEKCKSVTAVELSKQRASAIANRCKDKENLEIIVGNFNNIKFQKKFDYITLIGVLEYAPSYTNTEMPFYDFLSYIKKLLKPNGKLIIAIENQFGIKYFSGANEDHLGKRFEGLLGYKNNPKIRTFGKNELTQILKSVGLEYSKFYYPMPDYKVPINIFSDNYMPEEKIKNYATYTSSNETIYFDEREVLNVIQKNKMFDFFANSFLIECSTNKIDTNVNLEKIELLKNNSYIQNFFDEHKYKIIDNENVENKELKMLNEKLLTELNTIKKSKSWKIINKFRKCMKKNERN